MNELEKNKLRESFINSFSDKDKGFNNLNQEDQTKFIDWLMSLVNFTTNFENTHKNGQ